MCQNIYDLMGQFRGKMKSKKYIHEKENIGKAERNKWVENLSANISISEIITSENSNTDHEYCGM